MEHAKAKKAKGKAEKALSQMMMELEMIEASESDLHRRNYNSISN